LCVRERTDHPHGSEQHLRQATTRCEKSVVMHEPVCNGPGKKALEVIIDA
jgi:hypothetical protein